MGASPRTARGRVTRERIVRAASELVAERGVAGTSLDDVREQAHVSKSQLYLYFADKEALLREVAEATCDTVIDAQAEILAGFDSLAGIERYLDALVELQVQRRGHGGCPIGSLAGQLVERDEAARGILADGLERWESGLREGLEAMAERGRLKPQADPGLLANQTLALLQGGLLLAQVRRDPGQMRIAADAVLALVREAVRPSR
ncbi:MAG TPA: TetR/AcrR family transcriptional regulator [Solirubrobacteraceae bacterium]|jgi:AcrR family transcriptional regulator|nr:TetR/AcrR family transcriptional regulator [Solirubrobacteraceae bacterium]